MPGPDATVIPLEGDLVRAHARRLFEQLSAVAARGDGTKVVLDFSRAGRLDSSGIALIALIEQQIQRSGRTVELAQLSPQHESALGLLPERQGHAPVEPEPEVPPPVGMERLGGIVESTGKSTKGLFALIIELLGHAWAVIMRRERLPHGSLQHQILRMGVDAVLIVGLLSFLLGMTMAYQGSIQLQRFGAGPFVADMIGLTMVREISPLMTAVILTGRTGAAIAAELGTMQVRSEIDALTTMGIEPVRFLVLPRIASLTVIGPALSLLGMFIGMAGGMLVAILVLDMSPASYWGRLVDRLALDDFMHGIGKSFVFAWIIGFAGAHLGLRASGDAGSVGSATTRTVVVSVFFIIVVDAIFATVPLLGGLD